MQSRGGKGIMAMRLTERTGLMAAQLLVHEDEDIMLITDDGTLIRMPVADISILGRNTQGVRLMRVEDGCKVVCVARAEAEEDDEPDDPLDVPEENDASAESAGEEE